MRLRERNKLYRDSVLHAQQRERWIQHSRRSTSSVWGYHSWLD